MSDLAVIASAGALDTATSSQVMAWCEQGVAALDQATTLADAAGIRVIAATIEHATKLRDLNDATIFGVQS